MKIRLSQLRNIIKEEAEKEQLRSLIREAVELEFLEEGFFSNLWGDVRRGAASLKSTT